MMKIVALACFLVASVECTARDPKLFLVSSSTTTSTLTTSSLCYATNTGAVCKTTGKKKRHIIEGPLDFNTESLVSAYRNSKDLEIASGQETAAAKAGQREGKFLLYWMTTTSTTTSTSYTATASLSALECTPTSWTY